MHLAKMKNFPWNSRIQISVFGSKQISLPWQTAEVSS